MPLNIKTLKKTRDELSIEIEGEGHTFCNLLQSTLNEDKNVEVAGYDVPHPLTLKGIIHLKVKKETDPYKTLEKALNKITERTDEFLLKFKEATGSP
jgi:DNA-directed RNA polymerase subunit L